MSVSRFPRSLIRLLESPDMPLQTLEAIRRLRGYLDELERASLLGARGLGASVTDMGRALGISRQAVYNKLRALETPSAGEPVVLPELEDRPTE